METPVEPVWSIREVVGGGAGAQRSGSVCWGQVWKGWERTQRGAGVDPPTPRGAGPVQWSSSSVREFLAPPSLLNNTEHSGLFRWDTRSELLLFKSRLFSVPSFQHLNCFCLETVVTEYLWFGHLCQSVHTRRQLYTSGFKLLVILDISFLCCVTLAQSFMFTTWTIYLTA